MKTDSSFWQTLMELVEEGSVVLDRPQGNAHPRDPDMIYPLDDGYLENTSAADSGGIDVCRLECQKNANRNLMHV